MLLLLPLLPPSLGLSLVVQQQVRVVVTTAVCHHHRADGAGVDVLDLEKALDYVDVLRFNILWETRKNTVEDVFYFLIYYYLMYTLTYILTRELLSQTELAEYSFYLLPRGSHLEGFIEPEHRAGRHVAYPVQVPRDQVGLIQPAAEHIVRLVPHTRQQRVIFCSV